MAVEFSESRILIMPNDMIDVRRHHIPVAGGAECLDHPEGFLEVVVIDLQHVRHGVLIEVCLSLDNSPPARQFRDLFLISSDTMRQCIGGGAAGGRCAT